MPIFEKLICGQHIDVFGHMNHAKYVEIFEEARWHLCADLLNELKKIDLAFVVVNLNIDYKCPANCQDWVTIDARLTKINNSSLVMQQTMLNKQSQIVLSTISLTLALINIKTLHPQKINDSLKNILNKF
ncbi:MAG: hypothetical protein CMF49_05640 [Legionellales bacterium]|nr:hypothetical protein [Legionellales bacterium]|tara:strand:+ start:1393 stop:1782 length:390 start_codon:yes stop_codon:yes gene_type:complete